MNALEKAQADFEKVGFGTCQYVDGVSQGMDRRVVTMAMATVFLSCLRSVTPDATMDDAIEVLKASWGATSNVPLGKIADA